MNYLEFKNKMFDLACFSSNQVYAWQPNFDRNNFSQWIKRGLLVRLRQGIYTFPEYISKPDFSLYFANRIYRPSYVSLHTVSLAMQTIGAFSESAWRWNIEPDSVDENSPRIWSWRDAPFVRPFEARK